MARLPLPHYEAHLVHPELGLITRDWYDYFRERDQLTVTNLTYGTSIDTNAHQGNTFVITATNGTGFTINAPSNPATGQVITYTIRNTSGGALGTITWNSVFKMPTFTSPATGFSRSVTFHYNGTNWVQRYQSAADVPN